jgi:hypothetical protein
MYQYHINPPEVYIGEKTAFSLFSSKENRPAVKYDNREEGES